MSKVKTLHSLKWSQLLIVSLLPMNATLIRAVDSCAVVANSNSPSVVILKQWHLPPSVNTKSGTSDATKLPQSKNQKEIYDQLGAWVDAKAIDTVIAEGCEGEIDSKFKPAFQGWTYSDLDAKKSDPRFSDILSHAVVKLKVSHPTRVNALCGDSLTEIKKSEEALSDSRADVGYFSRIAENEKNPAKLKSYLDGMIDVYHLKPDATAAQALKVLALDLRASLNRFQDSTHARDLSFVQKGTMADSKKPVVIVIGGLHAQDLKQILESKKINCAILEPVSYQNDEEAMNNKLKALVK